MDCSEKSERERKDAITGRLVHAGSSHGPIRKAMIELRSPGGDVDHVLTGEDGEFRLSKNLDRDVAYTIKAEAFNQHKEQDNVKVGCHVELTLPLTLEINLHSSPECG